MHRHFLVALCLTVMLIFSNVTLADGSGDLEIEITAPLTAVDTTANTITVLGLVISVPASALNGNNGGNNDGQNGNDDGQNGDAGDDNGGGSGTPVTLASFAPGTLVTVKLSSDVAPFTATELRDEGAYSDHIKIKAPLQAVDAVAKTVTMLGLIIDVSTANFEGSNDDDSQTVTTTVADLAVGQSAEVTLDAGKLPALVATHIEVKNFTNQVDVELDDQNGNQVGDDSQDTTVDVVQQVIVTNPLTGKKLKKTLHIHTMTRTGKISLAGLVPGRAKLSVKHNGKAYHKNITVVPNGTNTVKIVVKH